MCEENRRRRNISHRQQDPERRDSPLFSALFEPARVNVGSVTYRPEPPVELEHSKMQCTMSFYVTGKGVLKAKFQGVMNQGVISWGLNPPILKFSFQVVDV